MDAAESWPAGETLRSLQDAGIELTVKDDKLLARPAVLLTEDLRELIRANKPELLALVAANEALPKTRYMVRKRDPRNVAGWFIRYSTLDPEAFRAEMGEDYQVKKAPYQNEQACVVHCKRAAYDVYIGRVNRKHGLPQSKWANPFRIPGDGTRDEVIAKYREWLRTQPELMTALPELRGKTLGCWCAPQPCHGDVLVELANEETKP